MEFYPGLGIKEQKSREIRGTAESCETREVAYTCKYASGHLIPILQFITMTELGITCPLVYLQVYASQISAVPLFPCFFVL